MIFDEYRTKPIGFGEGTGTARRPGRRTGRRGPACRPLDPPTFVAGVTVASGRSSMRRLREAGRLRSVPERAVASGIRSGIAKQVVFPRMRGRSVRWSHNHRVTISSSGTAPRTQCPHCLDCCSGCLGPAGDGLAGSSDAGTEFTSGLCASVDWMTSSRTGPRMRRESRELALRPVDHGSARYPPPARDRR